MKKRFTDEQMIAILKKSEAGVPVKEICRKHDTSDATFYTWRKKLGGLEAQDVRKLKDLGAENAKLNPAKWLPGQDKSSQKLCARYSETNKLDWT